MDDTKIENLIAQLSYNQNREIIFQIIGYAVIILIVFLVYRGIKYLTDKNQPTQTINLQEHILHTYKEIVFMDAINTSGHDWLDYETVSYFVVCRNAANELVNFQLVYNKGDGTISCGQPKNSFCSNCHKIYEDVFDYCPDCSSEFVKKGGLL